MSTVMEEENRFETNDIEEEQESYQYNDFGVEQVILQQSVKGNTIYVPVNEPSVQPSLFVNYLFNNTQIPSCQGVNPELQIKQTPFIPTQPRPNIVLVPPQNAQAKKEKFNESIETVEKSSEQKPKKSKKSNTNIQSLPQVLVNEQPVSDKSPEPQEKQKRYKLTYKGQKIDLTKTQERKGTNHQSFTQKIVKKVSNYHYNKNYRQQRDRIAKKLYAETNQYMTLQTFQQKLRQYKPKPSKKSTFIDQFNNPDEKILVLKTYQQALRESFLIMFKSEVRRNLYVQTITQNQQQIQKQSNSSESNSQEQQNKEKYAYKCIDKDGEQQLQKSFGKVFNKSVLEFEQEKQRQGSQIPFEISEFRQKLIRSLRS